MNFQHLVWHPLSLFLRVNNFYFGLLSAVVLCSLHIENTVLSFILIDASTDFVNICSDTHVSMVKKLSIYHRWQLHIFLQYTIFFLQYTIFFYNIPYFFTIYHTNCHKWMIFFTVDHILSMDFYNIHLQASQVLGCASHILMLGKATQLFLHSHIIS